MGIFKWKLYSNKLGIISNNNQWIRQQLVNLFPHYVPTFWPVPQTKRPSPGSKIHRIQNQTADIAMIWMKIWEMKANNQKEKHTVTWTQYRLLKNNLSTLTPLHLQKYNSYGQTGAKKVIEYLQARGWISKMLLLPLFLNFFKQYNKTLCKNLTDSFISTSSALL